MRCYEYHHIVGFEETNLVGNVYYANHIRWQGRCREMFLRDEAPDVLTELNRGLCLVTTRVSCEYYLELFAFDHVIIRMRAGKITQNRVTMLYDYLRANRIGGKHEPELIAHGQQQIAAMRKENGVMVASPFPEAMQKALDRYAAMDAAAVY